jgi:hypothetical protein
MIKQMSVEDLLKLPSVDSAGASYSYGSWSIVNALETKRVSSPYYQAIKSEIDRAGINLTPLHVDYGMNMEDVYSVTVPDDLLSSLMMGNGHHRLKLMIELGLTDVLVSDTYEDTKGIPAA